MNPALRHGASASAPAYLDHAARQALSEAFDPTFFARRHRDLALPGADGETLLDAYLAHVHERVLEPRADFSECHYLSHAPDVHEAVLAGTFLSGFHHWVLYGRGESRPHHPECAADAAQARLKDQVERLFDDRWYCATFMEEATATRSEALRHFVTQGLADGAVPVPPDLFDENFYLAHNIDVRAARDAGTIPSGYFHYITAGAAERRTCLPPAKGGNAPFCFDRIGTLEARLRPSPVVVDPDRPCTINVFLVGPAAGTPFGGEAFAHFLCRLAERGERLRFVLPAEAVGGRDWLLYALRDKPRWLGAFQAQEFAGAGIDAGPLRCHPWDVCVAGSAWAAHAAWAAVRELDRKEVLFFIEEYEPDAHENGAVQFLLHSAYAAPHLALFNSAVLMRHFRERRLGVFAPGRVPRYACFEPALPRMAPDPSRLVRHGGPLRLVCDVRTHGRGAQHLPEIAILALREALREGAFTGEWEFVGFGDSGQAGEIPLNDEHAMRLAGGDAGALLPGFDVGVSLVWGAHPGTMPCTMARAGVVTVTNACVARPAAELMQLGHNLVPCEPTLRGVVDGIWQAVGRAGNGPARLAGSRLVWPTDWDEVFGAGFFGNLMELARQPEMVVGRPRLMAAE